LGVASRLDTDRHGWAQRSIEALHRIAIVDELLLEDFARGGVEDCDLLLSRVQITSDECHESGLLFGVGDGPAAEPYQQRETVLMTSMNRRAFVTGLGVVLAAPLVVEAQHQGKIPRIGVLDPGSRQMLSPCLPAFQQGLRDLGYVEGRNIAV